ncbi:MAG TPA: hypothetical protein VLI06_14825, partial [Solimonas sp.]|nr:hypothetical protein [Solimonas sp.]
SVRQEVALRRSRDMDVASAPTLGRDPPDGHRRFSGGANAGVRFFWLLFLPHSKKSDSPLGEIKPSEIHRTRAA